MTLVVTDWRGTGVPPALRLVHYFGTVALAVLWWDIALVWRQ